MHLINMLRSKDMYIESLAGFANGIRTADGGAHIDGLKFAISKVVNSLAKKVQCTYTIHTYKIHTTYNIHAT